MITLHINDASYELDEAPEATLLGVLRDRLGLLGTRFGCGFGICGACYVLLDGRAAPSCKLSLGELAGRSIRTVEGLARAGILNPVQRAFLQEDAMQCGYCTSGMIISATALLESNPQPSEEEIREALAPHLCRCGVYHRAIRAIQKARP